jgi:hypothetical protein
MYTDTWVKFVISESSVADLSGVFEILFYSGLVILFALSDVQPNHVADYRAVAAFSNRPVTL